jgi:hypothetical protein
MKNDALPSPGFIPNGHRLRQELVKSISYVEVMADLRAPAKPEQAKSLDTFLSACKTAIAGLIDVTAPTFVSAAIDAATPKVLTITFSEPLDPGVVPAGSAFTSSPAKTFSKVEVVGNKVILTASAAYTAGAVTIAYTAPGTNALRDLSGLLLATFGAQPVTNGVV